MNSLPLHRACSVFPAMSQEELQRLAEDIAENGLIQPIVTYQGAVLDGRNRLAACRMAGVEPRFVDWQEDGSVVQWVVSQNVRRRHLNSSQKAVLALGILPMLEKEAKDRMWHRVEDAGDGKNGKPSSRGKASALGAKLMGTNATYVDQAKAVAAKSPELLAAVSAGKLTITAAHRICKMSDEVREQLVQKGTRRRAAAGAARQEAADQAGSNE